ncbi:MAG: glycosyltransferase family 4 protein, partial [Candidatus Binatia bacterium]
MRILLVTQRIDDDDDLLGFFVEWVRRLAARVEAVHVVAREVRSHSLPPNVRVHSLGKEHGAGRLSRLARLQAILFRLLVRERSADAVLCHMCPEYALAAYPAARATGAPLFLWYTHGSPSLWLRLAHVVSNAILTASLDGFPLSGTNVVPTGHGIDLAKFRAGGARAENGKRVLLSLGRISPVKAHEVVIRALSQLVHENGMTDLELRIVGETPLPSQRWYFDGLQRLVRHEQLENRVRFVGSVPYRDIHRHLRECDVFVSASKTGSLDKAPLEAMASGKAVLTSNTAFRAELGGLEDRLMFRQDDAGDLAAKLGGLLDVDRGELTAIGERLR